MTGLSWLAFLYLILFPFGQLGRIVIAPSVTLHLGDLVVGAIAVLWIVIQLAGRSFSRPPLSRPFLFLLAAFGFSFFAGVAKVSGNQALIGLFYLLRLGAYVIFYFAIWNLVRKRLVSRVLLFTSLIAVGLYIIVFGWLQYFLMPDLRPLIELGWDDHYFRLVGTFLDPAFTGILLVFFILLVFSRLWKGIGQAKYWVFVFLGTVTLAFTYSRASFLALFAGLATFYIVRRNLKFVLGPALTLMLLIPILPRPGGEGIRLERTSTVVARWENYREALSIGLANPLLGVGFNLYRAGRSVSPDSHSGAGSDSSLLFVFATTGMIGLISFLGLWAKILRFAWKRRASENGAALLATIAALIVHSSFTNSIFYPWVLGWMAILLGMQKRLKESK
ncbi:MAG: O-antigen ligase family protein [bacterium]|nr:O-antigen ligase family protein [bacterium]